MILVSELAEREGMPPFFARGRFERSHQFARILTEY
jgi:hypothetical protein